MNPDGSDPRYTRVAEKWEMQLASNPLSAAMHAMEPDHFHEDVELMGPDFAGYNFVTINPTTNVVTPTLGREGTLTAFYGDPRTWWASMTFDF